MLLTYPPIVSCSPEDAKAFLRRPDTAKLFSDLIVDLHVVLCALDRYTYCERYPTALASAAREIDRVAPPLPKTRCPYPLAKAASATPLAKDPKETQDILELLRPIRRLVDLEPEHLYDALLHDSHGCPPDGPNPIAPGLRDAYLTACDRFVHVFEIGLRYIYTEDVIDTHWIFEYKQAAFAVDLGARLLPINNFRPDRGAAEAAYIDTCRDLAGILTRRAGHLTVATLESPAPAPPDLPICRAVLALSKAHFDVVHSCYPDPAGLDRAAADFYASVGTLAAAEGWNVPSPLDVEEILPPVSNVQGTRPNFYSATYPILLAISDEADKGDQAAKAALAEATLTSTDIEYLSSFPRGERMISAYLTSPSLQDVIRLNKDHQAWATYKLNPSSFPPLDFASLNSLFTYMFPWRALWDLSRPGRSLAPSPQDAYPPYLTEPMPDAESLSPCVPSECQHSALSARYNLILNPCGPWSSPPSYVPDSFINAHHAKLDGKAQPPSTPEWKRLIDDLGMCEPCFRFIVDPLAKVASFIETRRASPQGADQPALGPIPNLREPEPPLEATAAASSARAPAPGPEPAPAPQEPWESSFLAYVMLSLRRMIGDGTFKPPHLVSTLGYFHTNLAAVEAEPRREASAASYAVHMVSTV